jgi:hypothetical protein
VNTELAVPKEAREQLSPGRRDQDSLRPPSGAIRLTTVFSLVTVPGGERTRKLVRHRAAIALYGPHLVMNWHWDGYTAQPVRSAMLNAQS